MTQFRRVSVRPCGSTNIPAKHAQIEAPPPTDEAAATPARPRLPKGRWPNQRHAPHFSAHKESCPKGNCSDLPQRRCPSRQPHIGRPRELSLVRAEGPAADSRIAALLLCRSRSRAPPSEAATARVALSLRRTHGERKARRPPRSGRQHPSPHTTCGAAIVALHACPPHPPVHLGRRTIKEGGACTLPQCWRRQHCPTQPATPPCPRAKAPEDRLRATARPAPPPPGGAAPPHA